MRITATKQIRQHGNSLTVNITKECGILGVGRGDTIEVTLTSDKDEKKVRYQMIVLERSTGNVLSKSVFDNRHKALAIADDYYRSMNGEEKNTMMVIVNTIDDNGDAIDTIWISED